MTSFPAHLGFRACASRMTQGAFANTPRPLCLFLPNQAEEHSGVRPSWRISDREHSWMTMRSAPRVRSFSCFFLRAMAQFQVASFIAVFERVPDRCFFSQSLIFGEDFLASINGAFSRLVLKVKQVPPLRGLRLGPLEKLKMPGFPTETVGTPTNREKARRYTSSARICERRKKPAATRNTAPFGRLRAGGSGCATKSEKDLRVERVDPSISILQFFGFTAKWTRRCHKVAQ
jgi:hypothetical protein